MRTPLVSDGLPDPTMQLKGVPTLWWGVSQSRRAIIASRLRLVNLEYGKLRRRIHVIRVIVKVYLSTIHIPNLGVLANVTRILGVVLNEGADAIRRTRWVLNSSVGTTSPAARRGCTSEGDRRIGCGTRYLYASRLTNLDPGQRYCEIRQFNARRLRTISISGCCRQTHRKSDGENG